jgi:hypothetical protein
MPSHLSNSTFKSPSSRDLLASFEDFLRSLHELLKRSFASLNISSQYISSSKYKNIIMEIKGISIIKMRRSRCSSVHKRFRTDFVAVVSLICVINLLSEVIIVDSRSPINVMAMKWWKDNKPSKLKPR